MAPMDPEGLAAQVRQVAGNKGLPPVHDWHPEHSGEIDIRIDANGRWYYQNSPFGRHNLVKLFASILRRDGDEYYLVTPVEKMRIQVEDVPFQVTAMEVEGVGLEQRLIFTTNMDERVVADAEHPLRVETDPATGEPRPYLLVRDRMEGLISRPVFYRLAMLGRESHHEREPVLVISSDGEDFVIGPLGEAGDLG